MIGAALLLLTTGGCLPQPPKSANGVTITVYAFSVMKEALEKAVFPGFAAKWKQEHGVEVHFASSFAGWEKKLC